VSQDQFEQHNATPGADQDRRKLLAQIGVGGAIAWAAPALSGTALAQGTPSGCTPQALDWNSFATGSSFSSTIVGGVTVGVTTTHFGGSSASSSGGGNLTIQAAPHGGINGKSLRINQNAVTNGGAVVTFTFSAPVQNIAFMVTDIDNSSGNWSDRVTPTTPGWGYTIPSTSTIIGVGGTGNGTGGTTTDGNGGSDTNTGAFRNSQNNINLNDNSDDGNLILTHAGPTTSFAWQFWCGGYQGSNQRINVSTINFMTCA